jgi:hypothetical protein
MNKVEKRKDPDGSGDHHRGESKRSWRTLGTAGGLNLGAYVGHKLLHEYVTHYGYGNGGLLDAPSHLSNVFDTTTWLTWGVLSARAFKLLHEPSRKVARITGCAMFLGGTGINTVVETPSLAPIGVYVHAVLQQETLHPTHTSTTPDPRDMAYGYGTSLVVSLGLTGAMGGLRRRESETDSTVTTPSPAESEGVPSHVVGTESNMRR